MKKRAGTLMLVQLVSVMGSLLFMTAILNGIDGVRNAFYHLYDNVTLVLLLILVLPAMSVHGIWKDFFRVFQLGKSDRNFSLCEIKKTLLAIELLQKQIIYGTIMIVGVYAVIILMNLDEPGIFGSNLALDIASLIYMAIALLFIEPLKVYTQRYLEDYLAEEED